MIQVTWRGTPGVGDFMMALNVCHSHAFSTKQQIELTMHWEHNENHLHHFEDPETIIERMEYIHNFYHRKDDVIVKHEFCSQDPRYTDWKWKDDIRVKGSVAEILHPKELGAELFEQYKQKKRFWFSDGAYEDTVHSPPNRWLFREDAFQETDRKKVVVWTPTFNAEQPRWWKRKLTPHDWDVIIHKLRRQGMNVIEIDYRTPVREAMYHIANCRLVVCYDGMWHYIAFNFARPMVVVSKEGITKYHTPQCVRVTPDPDGIHNIWWWLDNPEKLYGHPKSKAVKYENEMRDIWENKQTALDVWEVDNETT